jgi:hypothetical protein
MPSRKGERRGPAILTRILEENGPLAERIRARFDKSVLSRLASGERGPHIETGVALRKLTRGRILEEYWVDPARLAQLVKG